MVGKHLFHLDLFSLIWKEAVYMELFGRYLDESVVQRRGLGRYKLESHHSTNGIQNHGMEEID